MAKNERKRMKLSELNKLLVDGEVFPREGIDVDLVLRYAQALEAGAVFPAISVGLFEGKYYVVDGLHRYEAFYKQARTEIQAEVTAYGSFDEMCREAVKCNSTHGKPYTESERTRIIKVLSDKKLSELEISRLLSITKDTVKQTKDAYSFVVKRTLSGKEVRIGSFDDNPALRRPSNGRYESIRIPIPKDKRVEASMADAQTLKEASTFLREYKLPLYYADIRKMALQLFLQLRKEILEYDKDLLEKLDRKGSQQEAAANVGRN